MKKWVWIFIIEIILLNSCKKVPLENEFEPLVGKWESIKWGEKYPHQLEEKDLHTIEFKSNGTYKIHKIKKGWDEKGRITKIKEDTRISLPPGWNEKNYLATFKSNDCINPFIKGYFLVSIVGDTALNISGGQGVVLLGKRQWSVHGAYITYKRL